MAPKGNKLIKYVIGAASKEELLECIKNNNFSLLIDESTDISCEKNLCLVARYITEDFCVVDDFLSLLTVKEATAEALYSIIVNFFNENNVPYKKNMVGFASDGANNMMGKHNSVAALSSSDIENLFF